eukprot:GHUV01030660.1.p1 GENE.GHUV01030660.1~~GHUV01030660.1.p1  ORF type:complete len:252 (+),score=35.70 GHUV01030660.1:164-919(+)
MASHLPSPSGACQAALLLAVREQLQTVGFDVVHPFTVQLFNAESPHEHQLPTFDRSSTLAVVIGNSNRLWTPFIAALAEDSHLARADNPLDSYVEQRVASAIRQAVTQCCSTAAAANALLKPPALNSPGQQQRCTVAYELRFSHHTEPDRFVNMLRVAQLSGLAYYSTTTHLCTHPFFGPWFALRAVAVIDCEAPVLDSCSQLPCPYPELEQQAAVEMRNLEAKGGLANWQQHWRDWAELRALGDRYTDPK